MQLIKYAVDREGNYELWFECGSHVVGNLFESELLRKTLELLNIDVPDELDDDFTEVLIVTNDSLDLILETY
jgi:hypothetical protein